jgi:hypothetical protein
MNFNPNPTKALVITGQLRLDNNQTPTEIINYHIDYFKPDYTYLFLLDYEYEIHGKEIQQIPNTEIIIGNSNEQSISEYEMQHLILQLRKYCLPSIKRRKEQWEQEETRKALNAYMINPFIRQQTISKINLKHTYYINTRYDVVYMLETEKTQLKEIYQFLDTNEKTIATPFGGDAEGIGLSDLTFFANKSTMNIFKNYYNEIMEDVLKQIAPSFPEGFFRYMLVNKNQTEIFRFNFPCTTKSCLERDGYLLHANLPQYNIFKNNIPIPIAKYPKFETKEYNNPIFDLPLIKNPLM